MTFRKTLLLVIALVATVVIGGRVTVPRTSPPSAPNRLTAESTSLRPPASTQRFGSLAPFSDSASGSLLAAPATGREAMPEPALPPIPQTFLSRIIQEAKRRLFGDVLLAPFQTPQAVCPIQGDSTLIQRPYGAATHCDDEGWISIHAYDLGAEPGTPVVAIVNGVVRLAHQNHGSCGSGSWGAHIYFLGDDDNEYFYHHLEDLRVQTGQRLNAGDQIGEIGGWPGCCRVSHLHISIRDEQNVRQTQACSFAEPGVGFVPPLTTYMQFIEDCTNGVTGPRCSEEDEGEEDPIDGHLECQDEQCVIAEGEGFDECDSNAECVTSHTACLGFRCVITPEPGVDRCETDDDCLRPQQDGSHRACRDLGLGGQCAVVPGFGDDTCDGDCQDQPEPDPGDPVGTCNDPDPNVEDDEQCSQNGNTNIACNTNEDCTRDERTVCGGAQGLQCRVTPGPGINACGPTGNPDSDQCGCSGLAQQLLDSPNVTMYASSSSCNIDCGASSDACRETNPLAEFRSLAQSGSFVKFSLPGPGPGSQSWQACASGPRCPAIDTASCSCQLQQLLRALVEYADSGGEFRITSMGGATAHMCGSDHYAARAIDIVPENGFQRAIDFLSSRVYVLNECTHLHLKVDTCGETGTSTQC